MAVKDAELARGSFRPFDGLLALVPVAAVLEIAHAPPVAIFLVSAAAIVPLAGIMGRSTERLAERVGPGAGGLLNATFGNAAELILAVVGLSHGLADVVKASLTGSIIGNALLVLGLSILAGGLKHKVQRFNRTAASLGSTLMALAAIGLLVPTVFWYAARDPMVRAGAGATRAGLDRLEKGLSVEIAVVLGVVYLLSLVFSLGTHRHLYAGDGVHPSSGGGEKGAAAPPGARRSSAATVVALLLASSALLALLSEFLVGSLEPTARALGFTDLFVGVVVVAIVGNAAEHSSAVVAALRNRMDLALHIAIGSGLQIALFVTPLLVGISYLVGPAPIDLHFTLLEVGAVVLGVVSVHLVCQDGESNWMEGVLLLAVYAILAVAFYFLPA
ncbi:MAG: calcium/proton exchanger [Acidobacteriia bacterium]|nr:calcium/proton exchanger [Terriglobia bacterium]